MTFVQREQRARLSTGLCNVFGIFLLEITLCLLILDASVWRGQHPSIVLFTLGNIFVFVVVLMVCFVIFDFALSDATWIELLLMRP